VRIQIGKSLRFETFKRDGFVCQYCGASPPKATLEVDHIVPVAGGGGNEPDNLTTACFDCNRGKAARSLDVVPQSLADKAALTAEREEQLRGYQTIMQDRRERIESEVWQVIERWTGEKSTSHEKFNAIKRFIERIGVDEVFDAVDVTLGASIRSQRSEFLYFCKVCWNKVTVIESPQ
jgi:hypothetical protein